MASDADARALQKESVPFDDSTVNDGSQPDTSGTEATTLAKTETAGKIIGGQGGSYPKIIINDYEISENLIDNFELDNTDFYPTLNLQFSI